MAIKSIDISRIGDLIYSLLLLKKSDAEQYIDGVCENVYMDSLPDTIDYKEDRLAVIDLQSKLSANGAYGYGTVRVWLYADDSDIGAILYDLDHKLESTIDEYSLSKESAKIELAVRHTYRGHDKKRKLRFLVKELRVKIKD